MLWGTEGGNLSSRLRAMPLWISSTSWRAEFPVGIWMRSNHQLLAPTSLLQSASCTTIVSGRGIVFPAILPHLLLGLRGRGRPLSSVAVVLSLLLLTVPIGSLPEMPLPGMWSTSWKLVLVSLSPSLTVLMAVFLDIFLYRYTWFNLFIL